MAMEETAQQIKDAIDIAIAALATDKRILCTDTGTQMDFRVDQFTRNADGTWTASVLVRRDEEWVKLYDTRGIEVGLLSPASMLATGLDVKIDAALAAAAAITP